MLIDILTHTPPWVFALFISLVVLGYLQTRPRSVPLKGLLILPVAMLALSFSGVWNTFGSGILGLSCWLVALLSAVLLSQLFISLRGISYSTESQSFELPGSWLPLGLMMAIFFTKYVVGVKLAQNIALLDSTIFVTIASAAYGFWSGIFFGRMLKIVGTHGRQAFSARLSA